MRRIIILLTVVVLATMMINIKGYSQAKDLGIEALIQQLGDKDTYEKAGDILKTELEKTPPNQKVIDLLIKALSDPSNPKEVRFRSAISLSRIKTDQVIAALSKAAIDDEYRHTRKCAVFGLEIIGSEKAVPALTEALKDEELRSAAIKALGAIGRSGVPVLLDLWEKTLVEVEGQDLNRKSVTEVDIPYVTEADMTIESLVSALASTRDKRAIESLEQAAFHQDPHTRTYAMRGLEVIMREGYGSLPNLIVDIMGAPVEPGYEIEKGARKRIKKIVIKALEDEEGLIRKDAAYALGTLGDPSVIPRLKKLLTDDYVETQWIYREGEAGKLKLEEVAVGSVREEAQKAIEKLEQIKQERKLVRARKIKALAPRIIGAVILLGIIIVALLIIRRKKKTAST